MPINPSFSNEYDLQVDGVGPTPYGGSGAWVVPNIGPSAGDVTSAGVLGFSVQMVNPDTDGHAFMVVLQRFKRVPGQPIELIRGGARIVEDEVNGGLDGVRVWVDKADDSHLCIMVQGLAGQTIYCKFVPLAALAWQTRDPNS